MNIKILQLFEGAEDATGLAVIIDVFRVFSVDSYVLSNGAHLIIPVEDIERAYELKRENPDYILMGERDGKKPAGFDYGNSPTEIKDVDFTEKTIVQTTTAGTKGILNARNADEIITGSFVNAQAIIDYIRSREPAEVSLVCMGDEGVRTSDEDTLCAKYIKDSLEGKPDNFQEIIDYLRTYKSAQKFFDPAKYWAPERDFKLCLTLNRFPFIIKVEPFRDNLICLKKVENFKV